MADHSRSVRIVVTSDLHYDPTGSLTSPRAIRALVGEIEGEEPDAVVIAGDLAHGLDLFSRCLACFDDLDVPVAVLAGNHDVWRDDNAGLSSLELWRSRLPETTRKAGAIWLESEVLRVGDVAVVGSMVWYDYSALDPAWPMAVEHITVIKRLLNNDAYWINWHYTDPEFAAELEAALAERLSWACQDDSVRAVAVVTHIPILEPQIMRKPHDQRWGISNAYFGNLTTGRVVLAQPKVRVVVSGHTHIGRSGWVERDGISPVECHVVPSDYRQPAYVVIDL